MKILKQLPIPIVKEVTATTLSKLVDIVIENYKNPDGSSNIESEIDHIVYHLYNLTYDEVLIIDPKTPITREEYENFKCELSILE